MKKTTNITRTRVATLVTYGGSKPAEISPARWAACVKQVNNFETKS